MNAQDCDTSASAATPDGTGTAVQADTVGSAGGSPTAAATPSSPRKSRDTVKSQDDEGAVEHTRSTMMPPTSPPRRKSARTRATEDGGVAGVSVAPPAQAGPDQQADRSSQEQRVFIFSGGDKVAMESQVLQLGATASTVGKGYDPRCTHIVAGKLGRTEKVLCACAAGKVHDCTWTAHSFPQLAHTPVLAQVVLKPSYLRACMKAGRFIPEDAHEWGVGARGSLKRPRPGGKKVMWEGAPRRWRQRGGRAFDGHVVRLVPPWCCPVLCLARP